MKTAKTALIFALALLPTLLAAQSTPDENGSSKNYPGAGLLQVFVKDGGEWKVAAYHYVDVRSGISVPEPQ